MAVCKVMQQYEEVARKEGLAEGLAKGKAEGKAEGIVTGRLDAFREIREKLVQSGMPTSVIDTILAGQ